MHPCALSEGLQQPALQRAQRYDRRGSMYLLAASNSWTYSVSEGAFLHMAHGIHFHILCKKALKWGGRGGGEGEITSPCALSDQ